MSGAGAVVCEGWLRKSPPEKKLRRYAWKRRWFVLRSGRLSGEPDMLQYYKNPHSRRPIRSINLNLCEQVDAGLSFTKKELQSSFVFDLRTQERVWYLVAESEKDMNHWVSSICLLCGFNPTDDVPDRRASLPSSGPGPLPPSSSACSSASVPPPYDPVSVPTPHAEPYPGEEEEDYLWLSNCQSHTRPPVGSSLSLDTDYSDLFPAPCATSSSSSCSSSPSLLPPQPPSAHRTAPWTIPGLSQSLDSGSDPYKPGTLDKHTSRSRCHPSPHPRKHSLDLHLRPAPVPLCGDPQTSTPPSVYQVPRCPRRPSSTPSVDSLTQAEAQAAAPQPPPRPPKPPAVPAQPESAAGGVRPAALPRSGTEPQGREGGEVAGQSRTSTTTGRGHSESSSTPRSVSDRASIFEFSESFNTYFLNKGLVPLGSVCSEEDEADENYVPMSAATTEPPIAPRPGPPPSSLPPHEANYVSMTPLPPAVIAPPLPPAPCDSSTLGRQVPPPAHMGFRTSPVTPPPRGNPVTPGNEPPPIHRNLKPRKGVSVTPTSEKTDSDPTQKAKVKPAPLDMTFVQQQDWQEVPPPVRSPVTRTFTRDPSCRRDDVPCSAHSSSPSSDSDPDDNYVAMTTSNLSFSAGESSLRLMLHRASEGGVSCSPLLRRHKDKPIEYLDLDLHTGRTTPTRQKRSPAEGRGGGEDTPGAEDERARGERARGERARVEYVVVDPKRTKALRNTREAWHDGRMSTDKEKA
ncbi:GRB2-associated-binding protein 1-like [Periophthalmus magnuspinnatus]|uniref:GRB2-associated-binding protein 1-like n=1 Tax=Periophthalmus magnuspinnatus TaxID=409849 RepID=UPI00145C0163|nr:GRB2-associated-binding protein 1-like [Periophthalmus magnuspinnatus]